MQTKLKHQVFNQTKTGITIPNSILKEQLGMQPGDMVFAVMANGRIVLKRFSPNDLTDATDMAVLGVSTPPPSETPQIEAIAAKDAELLESAQDAASAADNSGDHDA